MIDIRNLIDKVKSEGYDDENAEAKVCHDIILKAISCSTVHHNVTIKGGIVMQNISHDLRRATQDIDIDFIRYPLHNEAIFDFVSKLNCLDGIKIIIIREIEELRQQAYQGKRVYIRIIDSNNVYVESKIDLGVHKDLTIEQDEYCFDISIDDSGVSLLMNSKEQIFTEKLKSLLKFGTFSTRFKGVFDLYYLCDYVDKEKTRKCIRHYISLDQKMRENSIDDIIIRIEKIFQNKNYINKLKISGRNWVDEDIDRVISRILDFIKNLRVGRYVVIGH